MKKFISLLLFCACISRVEARENAYDLLGKTLAPFVNLLSAKNPGHSVSGDLFLIEMTGIPPENAGIQVHVALENPDKLYLSGSFMSAQATLCRNGRQIWASPGGTLGLFLNQLAPATSDKKEVPLGNFVLGIPDNQLAFLPALFQVKEEGDDAINGESCRVLHLMLIPELAHSAGLSNFTAKIWIRSGYLLARVELLNPHGHVTLGIEHLDFKSKLPESIWQPPTDPAADVLRIDPSRIKQLFDFMGSK